MNAQKHLLEVYEPYGYVGPNPMRVQGTCVLRGPSGDTYYLLSIEGTLELEDNAVVQLLVLPRYNGDKIERAEQSCCTVNIARVRPGVTLCADMPFTYGDVAHWGVGKITPMPGAK
ncbi:MAG: hypothetical protein HZB57_03875 [Gammaproteobacteria bacterium]|nr:hypothetical protein [Gammaproteobacteria bacterium]